MTADRPNPLDLLDPDARQELAVRLLLAEAVTGRTRPVDVWRRLLADPATPEGPTDDPT
jgi:hypothetical protein